jgi:putative oxidoreductase
MYYNYIYKYMINEMIKKYSWCNTDSGLFVLRVGVAAIFLMTGWMKASNMAGTIAFFASIGFSAFWAYLVTAVELVGGLAVLLGVYIRGAAMLLAIIMIVAIYVTPKELNTLMTPIVMLFTTVSLVLSGGGRYSLKD